jgi:hypothetical protein
MTTEDSLCVVTNDSRTSFVSALSVALVHSKENEIATIDVFDLRQKYTKPRKLKIAKGVSKVFAILRREALTFR